MIKLSVNLNKFALIRNSRGTNSLPNLLTMAEKCIKYGVQGITVHPRPDARHITYNDVYELAILLQHYPDIEFNIEGYPNDSFINLVNRVSPHQATLVPDAPDQLTSDHGWDILKYKSILAKIIQRISSSIRLSIFVDSDETNLHIVKTIGIRRIELYTGSYAHSFKHPKDLAECLKLYKQTSIAAAKLGLGINAGHDLSLINLQYFCTQIPNLEEVSVGHALVVEAFEYSLATTIKQYLSILSK